jgi:photosystem II stability/assembly factor-like uncharacterized protein
VRPIRRLPALIALAALVAPPAGAQTVDPRTFAELAWRTIGPFRGGRTKAATGVPGRPNVFYVGAVNGGVWKTTDFGRTWVPLFDAESTGSVGAIAVAPSNPDIVYVGSGEGLQRPDLSTGDGVYRSNDGGKTWRHLGLRDGQQIPQIAVDPRDPNRLFVAVLGHPYGPNAERGLYRSTDGGESFQRVLGKDENTGAIDVVLDPKNPDVVYAALWEARQAPWENGAFSGPGSGLFKSTDGGTTWRPLTTGLPTFERDGLGRIGIAIAPSDPKRLYLTADLRNDAALYRSDDGGESWRRATTDGRVVGRASDFAEVKVHPKNPDVVFTASVVTWKSTDGGATFTALRGAPGGDDYHRIWINPEEPDIILIASDQGAIVTVNGGETWSSWYNQPTAQFYHVSADNAFPYRVCGGQQESGSACVASRGNDGVITFREWHPVGVEEYGYVAADPLDPDIVYGGKLTRYDRRTGQIQNIAPRLFRSPDYRVLRTAPVLFSPVNPRALYFASNVVWRTVDGGINWRQLSGDLTRTDSGVPPNVGVYASTPEARARHPGVVYTLGLSPLGERIIWAGSDDGLIHVTSDFGQHWRNVTPQAVGPWAKVSMIEPSHSNPGGAYAAINTFRLSDLRPHVYRTRDGGATWTEIVSGIPPGGVVNTVREDPKRKGLLFAGTEQTVYVSFDDGDHWQSLRLNLPPSSVRDLVIKDDDLLAGTHGRGFWILDDITPLRQISTATAGAPVLLFQPALATRVRWNLNPDTPIPPDEPAGANPPDGAIIDYWLGGDAKMVTIDVLDGAGQIVRTYSSTDSVPAIIDEGNVPAYWVRPTRVPGTTAGMHRFLWDVRYPTPAVSQSYPIAAAPHNTVKEPRGPWALPGRYRIRLTVDGRSTAEPLELRLDPRVKSPAAALQQQFQLGRALAAALDRAAAARTAIRQLRAAIGDRKTKVPALATDLDSLERSVAALDGEPPAGRSRTRSATLGALASDLQQVYDAVEDVDRAPTTEVAGQARDRIAALAGLETRWQRLLAGPIAALNARLRQGGAEPLAGSQ